MEIKRDSSVVHIMNRPTKAGFTHANFFRRFLKLSKQTQAKSRLNAMASQILKNL